MSQFPVGSLSLPSSGPFPRVLGCGGGLVSEPAAHPPERKVAAGANYRPQTQACKLLVGASPVEPL